MVGRVCLSGGFVRTPLEQQGHSGIYSQVATILWDLELEIVLSNSIKCIFPFHLLFNSIYSIDKKGKNREKGPHTDSRYKCWLALLACEASLLAWLITKYKYWPASLACEASLLAWLVKKYKCWLALLHWRVKLVYLLDRYKSTNAVR